MSDTLNELPRQKFKVTYNHEVYRPSNYDTLVREKAFELIIEAEGIFDAEYQLKENHNLNPFYFKIERL